MVIGSAAVAQSFGGKVKASDLIPRFGDVDTFAIPHTSGVAAINRAAEAHNARLVTKYQQ